LDIDFVGGRSDLLKVIAVSSSSIAPKFSWADLCRAGDGYDPRVLASSQANAT
jgi:hypothetical protein